MLEELARLLKPNGTLHVCEPAVTRGKRWNMTRSGNDGIVGGKKNLPISGSISGIRSLQKVPSALKLSGFVNVTETKLLKSGNELDACFKEGLRKLGWTLSDEQLETIALVQVSCVFVVCVCVCVYVCVCVCVYCVCIINH